MTPEPSNDMISCDKRGIYGNGTASLYVRTPPHNELSTVALSFSTTQYLSASFLVKILAIKGVIYSKVAADNTVFFVLEMIDISHSNTTVKI